MLKFSKTKNNQKILSVVREKKQHIRISKLTLLLVSWQKPYRQGEWDETFPVSKGRKTASNTVLSEAILEMRRRDEDIPKEKLREFIMLELSHSSSDWKKLNT